MEIVLLAIRNLRRQRMRSLLTILGITIGVAAIVSLISLGEGLKETSERELSVLGDKIYVMPEREGGIPKGKITLDMVSIIERIRGVEKAAPVVERPGKIYLSEDEYRTYWIVAFDPRDTEVVAPEKEIGIEKGRFMREGDKYVLVLGYRLARELEEEGVTLRKKVSVEGKRKFRIIGELTEVGSGFFFNFDYIAIMPLRTAMDVFDLEDEVSYIAVKVYDIRKAEEISEKIEEKLKEEFDEDIVVMTSKEIMKIIGGFLGLIEAIFVGIAAVSLLVAGIGIMNTMLMSVMERTREIGTIKALGATNLYVMTLFLVESALMGIIGAIMGISLGFGVASLIVKAIVSKIGVSFYLSKSPLIPLIGFLVALGSSTISGLYPAWRASKLSPVEALRHIG